MSNYNNQQGGNRPQSPKIYHSALVEQGSTSVQVLAPPKHGTTQQGKPYHKVRLNIFNPSTGGYVEHSYFTTEAIANHLGQYVNQTISIVASGSDHPSQNSARIDVIPAHHGPAAQQQAPQQQYQQPAPQPQQQRQQASPPSAEAVFASAKAQLKQIGNLARLCIMEAGAISDEANLTPDHRQALCASLLIAAEKSGLVASMPVQPIPFSGAPQQPVQQGTQYGAPDDADEDCPF